MTDHYDLQAYVIGGMLLHPEQSELAYSYLRHTDFHDSAYKQLYRICAGLHQEGKPVELGIVIEKVYNDPALKEAAVYSAEICVASSALEEYIKLLKERSRAVRVIEKCSDIAFQAPDDPLHELEQFIEQEQSDQPVSKTLADDIVSYAENLFDPDKEKRLYTGFPSLDRAICGLKLGTLSYIGARPSTGKTTFALNIARRQIREGVKTLLFSLEMSIPQILDRLVADMCELDYGSVNSKRLPDEQKSLIMQTLSGIEDTGNLHIADDVYCVEEMPETIAKYKPELVIVDFIQCVKTMQKFHNRRNEIDYISGELKRMARRYHCHVLCLSQVSRAGQDAPKMSDLKESGALEQDGDYIMMLHRPYVTNKGDSSIKPEDVVILLDKNKYGQTGAKALYFDGTHQRFRESLNRSEP